MTALPTLGSDDQAILEAGYQPKLRRSLGLFSSFAVSFSFISVTTGIFANYGYVLTKAGPFGIWTWPLVAIGQLLVALVYAEMAGRMPLAGCAYNWNTKLVGPEVGWFSGWLTVASFSVGITAVTITATPLIGTLLGFTFDPTTTRLVTCSLIFLLARISQSMRCIEA